MKINELLNEDDTITVKSVSGKDVELSNGIKTTTAALIPGTDPNTVSIAPDAASTLKPGAKVITAPTSEAVDDDFSPTNLKNLENIRDIDDLKSTVINLIRTEGPMQMKPDKIAYFINRVEQMHSRKNIINMVHHLVSPNSSMSSKVDIESDESEDDLIASGKNSDIGGDSTDDFIKSITDQEYGSRQNRGSYSESKELIAMLQIAGLR